MKYLLWILRILVFVILMGFALKNTDPVVVHFYLGTQWEAPVVFVLLVAFVLGATGGVLASLGVIFRRRREVAALRKQLRAIDSGNAG
ncbi:MAG TPA: lipopolysaccharide assembly protein LapA domain-containing protein [Burkholderiales bacterium]|nr:lipopolysaccharide assembly protein LapA domain-containing protein [Burkholderiales bacterium]